MIGLYLVITVLIISVVLLLIAAFLPKARHWKFRSPIQKIEPKKKRKVAPKKKKKSVWIRIA
jgi:hypothetical protein